MMKSTFCWSACTSGRAGRAAALALLLCTSALSLFGGTVGKVVAIGGQGSDLALDEARGVVYVANFTGNRIDVVSASNGTVQSSMNVAAQPASLALSPDGRYLVVVHYGNFTAPNSPANSLTVIDLNANSRQTYVLGSAPFSVAFGIDGRALVATATEFLSFDPATGFAQTVGTISGVSTKTLPVPLATLPNAITGASMSASGDGLWIFGSALTTTGGQNPTVEFTYDVTTRTLKANFWIWGTVPGPRAVSANYDGTAQMSGWALWDRTHELTLSFYHVQNLDLSGTHVFDHTRGAIYAQFVEKSSTAGTAKTPVLLVLDADNLRERERFQLPENFTGKSVLNSDASILYGVSDSGLMIIPIADNSRISRVVASKEDVVFRGNFCDRRPSSQEVTILDPSGGNSDFSLSVDTAGVTVTPSRGTTPATVRINVDPTAFQNKKGTTTAKITISSTRAANVIKPIRVLINNKEPDQRGSAVNVPGELWDLVADPVRDRFYVIRHDQNEVQVYEGGTQTRIATWRTAHRPTQLAFTFDRRYLLVAHRNADIIKVFDLETLEESLPVRIPGCSPYSVAVSGKAILAAGWCLGGNKILTVDFLSRTASFLPTLGVYENKDIDYNAVLIGSPNGSSIMLAQANGSVYLYNANSDTFTVSRKDFTALAGPYAASSFDQFVVGNNLLNASLVPVGQFETGTGKSAGFAFFDQGGLRVTAPDSASPGVISRVTSQGLSQATRMVEAPLLPSATTADGFDTLVFTRTVAPLYNRNAVVALTTSGFTVLPWNFDAAVAAPRIERVVNAADGTAPVAPGSLVSIFGNSLSPINQATQQTPLPTALGESCLTVNGLPLPVVFVSPTQINGQIPFQIDGNVSMVLRTPGGVSDTFNLTILPTAPSVFRNGVAGAQSDLPAVYRNSNGLLVTDTNPVHRGDIISIYLTGLGRTSPAVDAGVPAPGDPAATVVVEPAVSLAGVRIPVVSAELVPGAIGVYKVTARVTDLVPPGFDMPLSVAQGTTASTIAVRVVD